MPNAATLQQSPCPALAAQAVLLPVQQSLHRPAGAPPSACTRCPWHLLSTVSSLLAAPQGISKPLEAKLRPKGMGMGFGDYTEHKLVAEDKAQAKEKAKEEVVSTFSLWQCGFGCCALMVGVRWGCWWLRPRPRPRRRPRRMW